MSDPTCRDCGAPYETLGVDLVLPDQVWNFLCPEQGILCANCICKRLQKRGATTALLCWPDNFIYDHVQERPLCDNCGTAVPPGCEGLFRDDGSACRLNSKPESDSPEELQRQIEEIKRAQAITIRRDSGRLMKGPVSVYPKWIAPTATTGAQSDE